MDLICSWSQKVLDGAIRNKLRCVKTHSGYFVPENLWFGFVYPHVVFFKHVKLICVGRIVMIFCLVVDKVVLVLCLLFGRFTTYS